MEPDDLAPALPDYLTIAQACRVLGCEPRTLRRWMQYAQMVIRAHSEVHPEAPDFRFKLIARDDVARLAQLHQRQLRPLADAPSALAAANPAPNAPTEEPPKPATGQAPAPGVIWC